MIENVVKDERRNGKDPPSDRLQAQSKRENGESVERRDDDENQPQSDLIGVEMRSDAEQPLKS